jgi:hypothetical protein
MSPQSDEALGLAVHSLPAPGAAGKSVLTGRLQLLGVLLACSLPVLIAYFVFYVVRPQGEAGFGELVNPARPMPEVQTTDLNGAPHALPQLKAQWLLVKVDGGACQQECQRQLLVLRQLRLMLGKDMDRVDWVWLINDGAPVDAKLATNLAHDAATVVRVDVDANANALAGWLPVPAGKAVQDFFYVVDPMGNTMMRFPSRLDSAAAAKAKRDMEHVLKASMAWDTPGR